MREVLFRGKCVKKDRWVYGSYLISNFTSYILPYEEEVRGDKKKGYNNRGFLSKWVKVDPKTIGQWFGHKDTNSKDIYEGDFIKREGALYVVYFSIFFPTLCLMDVNGFHLDAEAWLTQDKNEIVGNLTDNPDMMNIKSELQT